jgi:hypothetical protein
VDVDGVELRSHAEVVAEQPVRVTGELLSADAVGLDAGRLAEGLVGGDHRPLHVGHGGVARVARAVEAVLLAPHRVVAPGDEPLGQPQVATAVELLVEERREQRGAGQRLARLELAHVVPPDAAVPAVPARLHDEAEGAARRVERAARVGGAVGVEEGEPPPAVVVEPDAAAGAAVAGVGRVPGRGTLARVPVALGAADEVLHRLAVAMAGGGDLDRVHRLEQRHDPPDRRQRVGAVGAAPVAVPVAAAVPPVSARLGHAPLGLAQVGLLRRCEVLGLRLGRRRHACGGEQRERQGETAGHRPE